jgi:hypothetical protein
MRRTATAALTLALALSACGAPSGPPGGSTPSAAPSDAPANVAMAKATEVLRGEGKVYVHVVEGQWDFWVMAPDQAVAAGDFLLLGKGPQLPIHRSGSLNRDFTDIIDLQRIDVVDEDTARRYVNVQPAAGGQTIAQLFAERQQRAGQPVTVRGRVVKANHGIFGTNWYHLRDGTGAEAAKDNDLTITSAAHVEVGALVVASGALTLDKDLGFGYFYPIIIEEAALKVD